MRPITGSSKPPEERYPERCLRVMYIEDEYDKFQPLPPLIRKWEKNFTIDLCTSTQELQDFYKQCKDSSSQSGNRPYDVLIADCRMDRSGDESDQARLAGLRSAIAAAEQFPNHPAVVIPVHCIPGR